MLREYIRTRANYYITFIFIVIILLFMQAVFNLESVLVWTIIISSFMTMTILFIINYLVIEYNFKRIRTKLNVIENPELITYYLTRPSHFESGYLYDMLDDISHSLYQKYKQNIDNQIEYQEYLLLFIHDLKLPIQNLKLITNGASIEEIELLEMLVDNLLNYSKISLKTVDIKITNVNLKELIGSVIKENFNLIIDNSLKIETDIAEVYISTDYYWLTFMIKQLISNAIKYSEEVISIRVDDSLSEVSIVISNDGPLIREDEQSTIFEKGVTGSNAKQNSTGYGLFYTNEVATKLNCKLQVNNDNNMNNFITTFKK